ncbi:MAG: hypothetical protein Ct9H300mP27_07560 [Chloroflexota bacterium]|nr:MAG: hypothetical protein Ct9H300mP27_07560 [Chloroflexota bacterium]
MEAVFGQDSIPDFDIGNTDYLLSFGADFLSTWVSPQNDGLQDLAISEIHPLGKVAGLLLKLILDSL